VPSAPVWTASTSPPGSSPDQTITFAPATGSPALVFTEPGNGSRRPRDTTDFSSFTSPHTSRAPPSRTTVATVVSSHETVAANPPSGPVRVATREGIT
jgi:hypothetical protein